MRAALDPAGVILNRHSSAMLPDVMGRLLKRHLEARELVEVMPNHRAEPMPMTLLYPHRRHLSRRLQVFAHWLEALLERNLP